MSDGQSDARHEMESGGWNVAGTPNNKASEMVPTRPMNDKPAVREETEIVPTGKELAAAIKVGVFFQGYYSGNYEPFLAATREAAKIIAEETRIDTPTPISNEALAKAIAERVAKRWPDTIGYLEPSLIEPILSILNEHNKGRE